MIKGDLRKKQILETAEALFGEKGYEATGVQDILDVLKMSKGSFYHHFESKEQVLQKICEKRAAAAVERMTEKPENETGSVRMNSLLNSMIPFQGEGMAFLKIILPVFVLPEGKSVRAEYQEAIKKQWLPLTEAALLQMIKEGEAYCAFPSKTAEMALDLINRMWGEISDEIIWEEKHTRQMITPSQLLSIVEPYRPALENLFSAPYGSMEIINLPALTKMVEEIHDWWIV